MLSHIECSDCGKRFPAKSRLFRCPDCRGSLEVILDYRKIARLNLRKRFAAREFNHARYIELYPVKRIVSLHEGGTPLVKSVQNFEFELFFKNETVNPTGSFKDRGSSIEVAKALEFGAKRVVCASTGNMGASVAAYSARADLDCSILVPRDARQIKLEQILAYGAKVYRINGDYTLTAKIVERANEEFGIYLLGDYLWRREGTKSIGFEIAEQIRADYIFCPIGNGTLISALWKALCEFKKLKLIEKLPKLVGVQASGCQPVCKAFKRRKKMIFEEMCKTIAVAIECSQPLDGKRAVNSLKESEGFCISVSDDEILLARQILAKKEGIFAEPAGAASFAGLMKMQKKIEPKSKVVCIVTGHGLKTPYTGVYGKPKDMPGRLSTAEKIFKP